MGTKAVLVWGLLMMLLGAGWPRAIAIPRPESDDLYSESIYRRSGLPEVPGSMESNARIDALNEDEDADLTPLIEALQMTPEPPTPAVRHAKKAKRN